MASAKSDFLPATTASPAARNSATSSRPCRAIHTLCQVSIKTAKARMPALNTSWPLPPKRSDKADVNTATRQAPSTPARTPTDIHVVRPRTPAVTAMTMPTIKPASKTSRNTMTSEASTETSAAYLFGGCTFRAAATDVMARSDSLASRGGSRRRNYTSRAAADGHRRWPGCRTARSFRSADRRFRIPTRSD